MKVYWILVLLFYLLWFMISRQQYFEPSWWSIFTSNRSTHTPITEHISLIKISITILIFSGLAYFSHRVTQQRNQ